MNIQSCIIYYSPTDKIAQKMDEAFMFFLDLVSKAEGDQLKSYADSLVGFISSDESIELAIQWINKGYIYTPAAPEKRLY